MTPNIASRRSLPFGLVLVALALLCVGPFLLDGYQSFVLCQMGITAISALGLTILLGHGGLVSLGHAAMMAVGAYAAAVMTAHYDIAFWIAVPAATVFGGAIGFIMGYPLLRLTGPYLAVATLGLAVAVPETILNWKSVVDVVGFGDPNIFGGHLGLQTPRPALGSFSFNTPRRYWFVVLAGVIITVVAARRIISSRFGRALRAFRESSEAAASFGVDTRRVRLYAFAISAAFAGLAGSLQAHLLYVISPASFGLDTALFLLMVVVVGGSTSIWGTMVAVALLTVLQEFVTGTSWNLPLVYGVIVALTVLYSRNGLAGIGEELRRRVRTTLASGRADVAAVPPSAIDVGA